MKQKYSPDTIEFRNAVIQDIPILIKLLHDDPLGMRRESIDDASYEKYLTAFHTIQKDQHAEIIVATQNNNILGMAQVNYLTYLTYQGGMRAQIEGIRIEKDHRKRGIGRKLIEHIITLSKAKNCHLIQLSTNKQRPYAIHFYEALGFKATHEGMKLTIPHK